MTTTPGYDEHDRTRPWRFAPPPPDVAAPDRLRGSAEILRHIRSDYPAGGLDPGTLVAVLLDRQSVLLGQARVRDLPADLDLPVLERSQLLGDVLESLRSGHPLGLRGFACLLVATRAGSDRLHDSDIGWWTALRVAGRLTGLRAADVLVSTPSGWFTVRAGTSGPETWPAE